MEKRTITNVLYVASDGTEFESEFKYRDYENRLLIKSELEKIKKDENIIYHKNLKDLVPPLLSSSKTDYIHDYFEDERYYYFTPLNNQGAKALYDFFENTKKTFSIGLLEDDLCGDYIPANNINKPIIIIIDFEHGYVACQTITGMIWDLNFYFFKLGYTIDLKKG